MNPGRSVDALSSVAPLLRVGPELQQLCGFGAQWASDHARGPFGIRSQPFGGAELNPICSWLHCPMPSWSQPRAIRPTRSAACGAGLTRALNGLSRLSLAALRPAGGR
jgi:hypothetical protein